MRAAFAAMVAVLAFAAGVAGTADAQERKPTPAEAQAIRTCAVRNADDVEAGARECLYKLLADACIEHSNQSNAAVIGCYEAELKIWDDLLNDNFKSLRAELDETQQGKLRDMQQAWIASRDRTCAFYYDKIQGSMAGPMGAACRLRETARRALLLGFFRTL